MVFRIPVINLSNYENVTYGSGSQGGGGGEIDVGLSEAFCVLSRRQTSCRESASLVVPYLPCKRERGRTWLT